MRRRAVFEGAEPTQEVELPFPEFGDIDPAVSPRQHSQQALQQHLGQRIGDLAALARVFQLFEMLQPFNDLIVSAVGLGLSVAHDGPPRGSKGPA